MNNFDAVRGSLIAAALWAAGGAFAQTTPAVMTDTTYAPAEDRDSVGAVLVEDNMVIAQRRAFGQRSTPQEVAAIGRGVMEATLAQAQAQGMEPDTRALGGPPATDAPKAHKHRRFVKPETPLSNP